MKIPAILAAFVPWIVMVFALSVRNSGIFGTEDIVSRFGLLWLAVSPGWFALGLLIAYREGQWSKK